MFTRELETCRPVESWGVEITDVLEAFNATIVCTGVETQERPAWADEYWIGSTCYTYEITVPQVYAKALGGFLVVLEDTDWLN